jgi:hypothetical protein
MYVSFVLFWLRHLFVSLLSHVQVSAASSLPFPGHKITGLQDCNTVHTAKQSTAEQNRVSLLQIFFLNIAIAVLLGAWRLGQRFIVFG